VLLKEIISKSANTNQYIERYLNDGSPSGFTTIYTTSPETSPFGTTEWFYPYICIAPFDSCKTFGQIPSWGGLPFSELSNWVLVHPDMSNNKFFLNPLLKLYRDEELIVVPTASGRTVQIINKERQDYVKLHYEGILGRVRRELPYNKAIGGPEVSRMIIEAIDSKILPCELSLLPERGARVLEVASKGKKEQWGMVWRENKPYGVEPDEIKFVLPVFSLFSFDRLATHHFPLLKQIIDFTSANPEIFILDVLIAPLLKCYFELILKLGLQAEWNAQNLQIGFNESFSSAKFIMRDLESVDKDLTMMDSLKIMHVFESYPYKCIFRDQYNYTIKHSFMYDFKLGDYILDPLLVFLYKYYRVDYKETQKKVKEIAKQYIDKLPNDFFPKDKWFIFEKVLVDQSVSDRPYIELDNPKFRF
jgi:hypothetical protein